MQLLMAECVKDMETVMKKAFLIAGVCGVTPIMAVAAQNRGFDGGGPASRLASALDEDRDGVISAAEVHSAPAALKVLDTNGDGRLTPDELGLLGPGGPRGEGPGFGGRRGRE